jgi:hypothetical protein
MVPGQVAWKVQTMAARVPAGPCSLRVGEAVSGTAPIAALGPAAVAPTHRPLGKQPQVQEGMCRCTDDEKL